MKVLVAEAQRLAQRPEMLFDQRSGKRSWPAGTGVCVVKTICGETRRIASCASMPSVSIRWRTSSSAANALCPSFRCTTPGAMPMARERPHAADAEQQLLADADALIAAVEARRQLAIFGLLPSTFESSSSSVLRPTASFQTRAAIVPVRVSIVMMTGSPRRRRLHRQLTRWSTSM